MRPLPRLYAIADAAFGNPIHIAEALFAGGAELVQVRDKSAGSGALLDEVHEILKLAPAGRLVIVNDRADVTRLAGAAGVHLGQTDLAPAAARRVLSSGQVIGVSSHSIEQALAADGEQVDYIAAGPVFATASKANPDPVIGLDGLRQICSHVHKPVVAIGGITLETSEEVLACGATSIAVISDLLRHADIAKRTEEWLRKLESRKA
jgi:thiamine-phosphate pyrophosphorylase